MDRHALPNDGFINESMKAIASRCLMYLLCRRSRLFLITRQAQQEMYVEFADLATRLIAAAAAGGVLGIERDLDKKPIGVRTLAMVSLGGAMLTVAATEVSGLYENKDALSRWYRVSSRASWPV